MKKDFIKEQEEKLEKDCKDLEKLDNFSWKPLAWAAAIFGISISGGIKE